jgi:hypothetical protein
MACGGILEIGSDIYIITPCLFTRILSLGGAGRKHIRQTGFPQAKRVVPCGQAAMFATHKIINKNKDFY